MILTTHALIGAAIGKHISNPWLIVAIAIPLHYLLDTFRHGEYLNKKSTIKNTLWKVSLDLAFGLTFILTYILFSNPSPAIIFAILLGAFISMFPDLITFLHWQLKFPFLEKPYKLHQFVHSRFRDGSPEREWNLRNAANDIVFSLLAIIFILL